MKRFIKTVLFVLVVILALLFVSLMNTEVHVNEPQITVLRNDAGAQKMGKNTSGAPDTEQVSLMESAEIIKKVETTILERQPDRRVTNEVEQGEVLNASSAAGLPD